MKVKEKIPEEITSIMKSCLSENDVYELSQNTKSSASLLRRLMYRGTYITDGNKECVLMMMEKAIEKAKEKRSQYAIYASLMNKNLKKSRKMLKSNTHEFRK